MARPFSSPTAVATFFSALALLIVIGGFAFLQFAYLQPTAEAPVTSRYPIAKVVHDMGPNGPYDQAQLLVDPTGSGSLQVGGTSSGDTITVVSPVPVISAGDLGKSDLSKFNQ